MHKLNRGNPAPNKYFFNGLRLKKRSINRNPKISVSVRGSAYHTTKGQ
jgi:hypothetical protein